MITKFLLGRINDGENVKDAKVRRSYGTLSSVIGICVNIFLSVIKLFAGVLSGSIAITADAANNLSDAGSQVVSLISFRMSAKPADRDHPFGHARIEYVAAMIVSFIILLVGAELFGESVDKIFYESNENYSNLVLVILALSVIFKLWLAYFNRRIAKKIDSTVIKATSTDSLSDAGATFAVLVSAILGRVWGIKIDAYMGIAVAILIFVAGIRILNETKNSILGSAPDKETVEKIVEITKEFPDVLGIHDLIVHSYGAGNLIASFHAEVDGKKDVYIIHDSIDNLEKRLYNELGVRTTVHMDPIVTDDARVNELCSRARETVKSIDARLDIHDFRFVEGVTHSNLIFDVSVPFECKISDRDLMLVIDKKIKEIDESFVTVITVDRQ